MKDQRRRPESEADIRLGLAGLGRLHLANVEIQSLDRGLERLKEHSMQACRKHTAHYSCDVFSPARLRPKTVFRNFSVLDSEKCVI